MIYEQMSHLASLGARVSVGYIPDNSVGWHIIIELVFKNTKITTSAASWRLDESDRSLAATWNAAYSQFQLACNNGIRPALVAPVDMETSHQ